MSGAESEGTGHPPADVTSDQELGVIAIRWTRYKAARLAAALSKEGVGAPVEYSVRRHGLFRWQIVAQLRATAP
jgi:hypothetical protein